ncbi:MAG: group II intron reverse transcriptase/maturase, partial [Candidatus Omnitrophica bacterium]|nr:group II intron reverse transcriptase/maturase [Candidatus Omnitrophota bacterium]
MSREEAEVRFERNEAASESMGRNPGGYEARASNDTVRTNNSSPEESMLMEAVVGRENMRRALRRV